MRKLHHKNVDVSLLLLDNNTFLLHLQSPSESKCFFRRLQLHNGRLSFVAFVVHSVEHVDPIKG